MKKSLAALAAIFALFTAAPASAEPPSPLDEFVSDMSDAGFNVSESENQVIVVALGLGVCVDMFNGSTFREEVAEAVDAGLDVTSATQLISLAITDLCPGVTAR